MKANINRCLLILFILITTSCTSTDTEETVTSVTYDPYPVSIDFQIHDIQLKHGIITIYPELRGRYQSYNSIRIAEKTTEKNLSVSGAIAYPIKLALLTLIAPLSQLDPVPMSGEKIVEGVNPMSCSNLLECKKEKTTYSRKTGVKADIVDRKVPEYRNGELVLKITGNNTSFLLPVYNHAPVSFALRELGSSESYTITPMFYGALADIDYTGESYTKHIVPESYLEVEKQIKGNRLVIDSSSIALTEFISDSWNFNIEKNEHLEDSVDRVVKNNISEYLSVVEKPKLPAPIRVPKVTKPDVPESPILEKDQFETTAEFNQRVADSRKKQLARIAEIETEYKVRVKKRNEIVQQDNQFIKEMSDRLIKNYESRLATIKESLEAEKRSQVAFSYLYLINSPTLKGLEYDADNQTLYAMMMPSQVVDNFEYRVKTIIPTDRAREIYNHSLSHALQAKLTYQFRPDYSLKNIASSFYFEEDEYVLENAKTDFKLKAVSVSLPKISPDWSGVTIATSESLSLPKLQELQGTTLLEDKDIKIVNTDFDDDIPNLLRKTAVTPKARNKWLLAIGIEKYKYIDDIAYSKRSANLFVQTMQKKVGIKEENTIFLLNNNATAGAIKDHIKILLEKISEGDIVYFYYNGHGVPNAKESNEPYILASDQYANLIDDPAFKLRNIYKQFSNSNAGKVFFFIDSCFSNTHQGGQVAAPRLVPKKVDFNSKKLTVLSAADRDQFSNAFSEKGHRLFSYYLMKSILQDRHSAKSIYRDIYPKVRKQSAQLSGYNIQEPTIQGNEDSIL